METCTIWLLPPFAAATGCAVPAAAEGSSAVDGWGIEVGSADAATSGLAGANYPLCFVAEHPASASNNIEPYKIPAHGIRRLRMNLVFIVQRNWDVRTSGTASIFVSGPDVCRIVWLAHPSDNTAHPQETAFREVALSPNFPFRNFLEVRPPLSDGPSLKGESAGFSAAAYNHTLRGMVVKLLPTVGALICLRIVAYVDRNLNAAWRIFR
jgi:hypothetical protein